MGSESQRELEIECKGARSPHCNRVFQAATKLAGGGAREVEALLEVLKTKELASLGSAAHQLPATGPSGKGGPALLPSRGNLMHSRLLVAALAASVLSCSDSGEPNENDPSKPASELTVLRLSEDSPPLLNPVVSFYAVRGQNREARIFFDDGEGREGDEYLRLRFEDASLLAYPDGIEFAEGDSVLITIRVVDPARTLFELEPTGLQLSSQDPAELRIRYQEVNDDLNEDGAVDVEDVELERSLAIWRQEKPGDPFVRLGTILQEDIDEVRGTLEGFSRYALAY
jgi:hypothetical protein